MDLKRASLAGYAILVLALLGLVARKEVLAEGPAGLAAQAAAAALMIWARFTFGIRSFHAGANPTSGGLVTNGPYRYVRHPIYAAILLFFAAAVLTHLSVPNFLLLGVAAAGVAMRIRAEERLLVERYPEYAAYAARTGRLIPFLF